MPVPKMVVRLWCLPTQTEEELKSLHQALVAALVRADIGIMGENDVIVLFPSDMMTYGLGSEILVEISHLPTPTNMNYVTLKWHVAHSVETVVKRRFPDAYVQGSFLWVEDFPSNV